MMLSDVCLSDVCLSRTSGLSREHRCLGRLKLAQRWPTSHVIRTPLSRSKGQRSRSPGRFTHCGVNASCSCSGESGNILAVRTYTATLRSALCRRGRLCGARRFGAHRWSRGAGHIVAAARLQLVIIIIIIIIRAY